MNPTIMPLASSPAFKEWTGIVEALGQGHQTLILRKGGIAEGRQGFQPNRPQFWLFPTGFHQQWEKTRPELRPLVEASLPEINGKFALRYVAEVTHAVYLESWVQVERLRPFHYWSEAQLRERFDYKDRPGMELGLHLLIVRVRRVAEPIFLESAKAYEGCKSWIEVPVTWQNLTPVLSDEKFAAEQKAILSVI